MGILLDFDFLHIGYRRNQNANLIQDFSATSMFSNAVGCKENKTLCFAFNTLYYHKKLTSNGIPEKLLKIPAKPQMQGGVCVGWLD